MLNLKAPFGLLNLGWNWLKNTVLTELLWEKNTVPTEQTNRIVPFRTGPKYSPRAACPASTVHRVVLAYCHAMHAWPSISIICSCSAVAKHHCWVFVTSCSWAECPGSAAIQYGVVWCGMVWYGRGSRDRWLSWSRDDKLVLYRLELRRTRRSGFRSPRGEEMIPVTSPHHQC